MESYLSFITSLLTCFNRVICTWPYNATPFISLSFLAKPGLIVLCVVGGVAVLAIIVAIIAYGLHRKKSDVGSFSNGKEN